LSTRQVGRALRTPLVITCNLGLDLILYYCTCPGVRRAGSTTTSTPTPPAAPPDAANDRDAHDRDAKGRFARGNKGGPGNPLAGKVNKVRKAFLEFFEGPA
jgi:hypothetical protein